MKSAHNIQCLYNNCYDRHKNKYIAKCLLPIFEKHTALWKAIPFLCYIKFDPLISNMLEQWLDLTPMECECAIEEIIRIFSED